MEEKEEHPLTTHIVLQRSRHIIERTSIIAHLSAGMLRTALCQDKFVIIILYVIEHIARI